MSFSVIARMMQEMLTTAVRRMAVFAIMAGLLAGLPAAAQTAQSVTLAWDANPEPDIAGYRVYYGTSIGNYSQSIDVGNVTGTTISNLTAGQTYYFAVTDYNTAGVESPPSNAVAYPVAKDFNGDGYADLVWENIVTGQRGIWLLKNGVLSSIINLPTIPVQWRIAGVGDFNGDGQADLVWENTVTGQRGIWLLKNGVLSSIINLPTIPVQWHIAGAGDFTGDGYADLVWENTVTGQRGIWLLKNGVLSSIINLPTEPAAWNIADH